MPPLDLIGKVILLTLGCAVGLVALLGLAHLIAYRVAVGWTKGTAWAERQPRPDDDPLIGDRPVYAVGVGQLRASAAGGVCAVGHYVHPGAESCSAGHRYNVRRTFAMDWTMLQAARERAGR